MESIGICIDRKTGQVIGADMPPANIDAKALWDRELKQGQGSLLMLYLDCLGGDELEQERMWEYGRRSGFVPAVQELYAEHDPLREPPAGQ